MNGALQNRINPGTPKTTTDFSAAKVATLNGDAVDSTDKERTSFKDLLFNSNTDQARARVAQKNGDGTKLAKTDEEFANAMLDKINKENLRKPQNELDKDAFLKLFITQMQNQDPLNPDNSAEMAAQLAQFHGLEQMLNVNKNLEKMQTDQALSRSVNLINFVGKDLKLESGKLKLEDGKLSQAVLKTDVDIPKMSIEVRDAAGVVVHAMDVGYVKAGETKLEWNGLGKGGKQVPDGVYTFSAVGKDMQDNDVPAKIVSSVKVTGVDLTDQGGAFYTNLGKIRINEVASVGDAGTFGKGAKPGEVVDQVNQAAKDGMAPVDQAAQEMTQEQFDQLPPEVQERIKQTLAAQQAQEQAGQQAQQQVQGAAAEQAPQPVKQVVQPAAEAADGPLAMLDMPMDAVGR